MTAPRVDERQLGRTTRLGRGGAATVFAVPDYTVRDFPGALAFKRFTALPEPSLVDHLDTVASFRMGLGPDERRRLDALTSWPLRLVTDGTDRVCGILLPQAQRQFFYTVADRTLNSFGDSRPSELQHLFGPWEDAREQGVSCPPKDDTTTRLALVLSVCATFAVLERHGIVFGDVSSGNILYSLDPVPRTLLIDCDAVAITGTRTSAIQGVTPGFTPPEGSGTADVYTDRYKLGLLILRSLAPALVQGHFVRAPSNVRPLLSDRLDEPGLRMLEDALSEDREARPSAGEWFTHLHALLSERTSPPVIDSVELDHPIVVEGAELVLQVRSRGALTLRIDCPGGEVIESAASGGDTVRFTAMQSGAVRVLAANHFGQASDDTRSVRVLPVPTPTYVPLPTPVLPGLDREDLYILERGLDAAGATRDRDEPFRLAAAASSSASAGRIGVDQLLDLAAGAQRLARELEFPVFTPLTTTEQIEAAARGRLAGRGRREIARRERARDFALGAAAVRAEGRTLSTRAASGMRNLYTRLTRTAGS
ncbi:hypothetical protein SAMN06295885_0763 [Rathayibacter oskolensis]|uniref:Protein kinase domain-containing protein n=1 Tax=Rathayibacter oskolensis TaxID=1891671 RepID=A0A1X7N6R2_9MICO|nr:hypothetical protein [Rathayibacter oskolensis]SMH32614.1 hypothetical protein SAMN06295885_0763 [Rathayibacter oskolensis]